MSSNTQPKSPAKEICYSDDETMQRRLLRKRQLEESEIYNAPETMAVKRRAVKEAAKKTPVPKKIPNLNFDDQIEPSETLEHEHEQENGEAPMHAEEKGSNAAQSGVDAARDSVVVVEVPIASQKDSAMVDADEVRTDAKGGNVKGKAGAKRKAGSTKKVKKEDGVKPAKVKKEDGGEPVKVKPTPKVQPVLPKVLLDPRRWAKKSDQAARRSRHRLRRLLKEEEALLSSQLQAV